MSRSTRRTFGRLAIALAIATFVWAFLLIVPDPLFAHELAGTNIVLHADMPFPTEAREIVSRAEAKIASSPLFVRTSQYHLYICRHPWQWNLFTFNSRGGAIALAPIGRAMFSRAAHLTRNRLVGPSGRETPEPERTFDYYVAHETAHTMTADHLGPLAFWTLPEWVREGYADYIGRGESFDYETTRAQLLAGDRALDPQASGLYLRHVLFVAHLLDREQWDVATLLRHPPNANEVEQRVRDGTVSPSR